MAMNISPMPDDMDKAFRIVVAGASESGQSTFVHTASDVPVERSANPAVVAMDIGWISASDSTFVYLFSNPPARRLDYRWEILGERMLGFIVMLDSRSGGDSDDSKAVLKTFHDYAPTPYVIAANFQDHPDARSPEEVRRAFSIPQDVSVVACTATDKESVKRVIVALLETVLEKAEREAATRTGDPNEDASEKLSALRALLGKVSEGVRK